MVWLGDGTGLFPETFLKRCGGVTGLGTHISPNHLLEQGYSSTCSLHNYAAISLLPLSYYQVSNIDIDLPLNQSRSKSPLHRF